MHGGGGERRQQLDDDHVSGADYDGSDRNRFVHASGSFCREQLDGDLVRCKYHYCRCAGLHTFSANDHVWDDYYDERSGGNLYTIRPNGR